MSAQRKPGRLVWAMFIVALTWTVAHGAGEVPYVGPAESASSDTAELSAEGALRLSLQAAIVSALAHNRELRVELLTPAITRSFESAERAVFDPVLGGTISWSRYRDRAAGRAQNNVVTEEAAGEVYIEEFLPTGTTLRAEASGSLLDSRLNAQEFSESRVGVTVTQALMRGMPVAVNLARLHQARLDTRISEYELRAFVEALVATVENTYWDLALASRKVGIVEQSLDLARQQFRETNERVKVGRISESELAAAEAEVARRQEELIDVTSALDTARLELLRLINAPGRELMDRAVTLLDSAQQPNGVLEDAAEHIGVARRMRPDLNQARLAVKRGDLELVRTENGLLPKLDFFLTLGATGYDDHYGRSLERISSRHYDVEGGFTVEFPPINTGRRGPPTAAPRIRGVSRRWPWPIWISWWAWRCAPGSSKSSAPESRWPPRRRRANCWRSRYAPRRRSSSSANPPPSSWPRPSATFWTAACAKRRPAWPM